MTLKKDLRLPFQAFEGDDFEMEEASKGGKERMENAKETMAQ